VREKQFGQGLAVPLDRNAKTRIMVLARALSRRTEKGRAYGILTAKAVAVLQALLWRFHNAGTGRCFPSYEAIAEAAGCARSTVAEALHALERAGVLTWCNRLLRVRERCPDLFGPDGTRIRVVRTSNAYAFNDPVAVAWPQCSKSERKTGTRNQVSNLQIMRPVARNGGSATPVGQHATALEAEKRLAEWQANPPQFAIGTALRAKLAMS
jgi:hypothetical protein